MTIFEIILVIFTAMSFIVALIALIIKIVNIYLNKKEITRPPEVTPKGKTKKLSGL